jgi:tetratricopeptide (TPR) repeat protein
VEQAACELFVERAIRVAPDLDATSEAAVIRELCALLEGMPLAIELAASWAGTMSCRSILREVRSSFGFLRTSARDVPERHQSMRRLFDTSWNALGPQLRSALRRLSVCRGGFSAPEAQRLAGVGFDELRALVAKSLLRVDDDGRFTVHEVIRQFAAEELASAGEAESAAGAHFDAYLALAEEAEPELIGGDQPAWLTRLELEWDNFRAALRWGFDSGRETDAVVRLVVALSWFWRRAAIQEAHALLVRALALEGLTVRHRASLLSHAGHVSWMVGRLDVAEAHLLESLDLWERLGLLDGHEAARTRCSLAMTRYWQGRYDDARSLAEGALAIFRANDTVWWIAFVLAWKGKVALATGAYERARGDLLDGLALFRSIGNRWGLGLFLGTAAQLHFEMGDLDAARALAEEGCALLIEIGHKHALGDAYRSLGAIAWAQGDRAAAERSYRAGSATYRELGDERFAEAIAAELARHQSEAPKGVD